MAEQHVRHPAPINQFYVLDRDSPTSPWKKLRRWNDVIGGHNFDSENCMAAEGAVAIDAHTNGHIHTSPAGIRNWQDDLSGGIGVDDVDVAFGRHFGASLLLPGDYNWADVINAIRARRHVLIAVDYRVMPPSAKAQIPGSFDHALGLDDIRDSDGYVLVYDSLRTDAVWLPQSSVRIGAERLAVRERGSNQRLFVGLTAARPALNQAAPHYQATVKTATSLWNDTTKRWVYNGPNRIKPSVRLEVRRVQYRKGERPCYPVTAGAWSTRYPGYYVPVSNVTLGGPA